MRGLEAGSLVGLLLMYVFWAPYVVMIGVVNANTAGYTKRQLSTVRPIAATSLAISLDLSSFSPERRQTTLQVLPACLHVTA